MKASVIADNCLTNNKTTALGLYSKEVRDYTVQTIINAVVTAMIQIRFNFDLTEI